MRLAVAALLALAACGSRPAPVEPTPQETVAPVEAPEAPTSELSSELRIIPDCDSAMDTSDRCIMRKQTGGCTQAVCNDTAVAAPANAMPECGSAGDIYDSCIVYRAKQACDPMPCPE